MRLSLPSNSCHRTGFLCVCGQQSHMNYDHSPRINIDRIKGRKSQKYSFISDHEQALRSNCVCDQSFCCLISCRFLVLCHVLTHTHTHTTSFFIVFCSSLPSFSFHLSLILYFSHFSSVVLLSSCFSSLTCIFILDLLYCFSFISLSSSVHPAPSFSFSYLYFSLARLYSAHKRWIF